ncbi:hypothetical protein [Kozakia baliensis]|nr:hypothetical protein [Kozakia baliensis]GBR28435.1 hypothetical protein AA0488_1425 [Kozakia baliensis NRIC 0488]GEL63674.1 hypothetical protein KBA01_09600 [Kozakia baliensis]
MRLPILAALAALACAPQFAAAQTAGAPSQMTPAMQADIAAGMNYRLPNDFIPRATSTLQALQAAGIQPPNSTNLSLRDTIARIGSVPGLPQILHAHGFSPEQFVMGMTAFGMTLAATNGQNLPSGIPQPNPANVALFHAHPEQVTALMQAMGTPPGQSSSAQVQ